MIFKNLFFILFLVIYSEASSNIKPSSEKSIINKRQFSKSWIEKEMKCFKLCIINRKYDSYSFGFGKDQKSVCTCKNIKLAREDCVKISDEEYLQRFKTFKQTLINTRIKPLLRRYTKHFPQDVTSINPDNLTLFPSQNYKKNVIIRFNKKK